MPRIWIDIDNPPQVQYLLPFRDAFAAAGVDTVITARDYGATLALLERAGVDAEVFGTRTGSGRTRKVLRSAERARALTRLFRATGRPDALLSASRPSALAAWRLGIPCFIFCDYEHANGTVYGLTGSTILYADSIDPKVFHRRVPRQRHLVPFSGFKEDITFRDVDVAAVEPYPIAAAADVPRVLFRPPSETSHYYRHGSTAMALATLRHLATTDAVVVFSPREPGQAAYLEGLDWAHQPVVLERPAPVVPLLKSVDAVVCSGGTMLREAAYLGIPAYSIFQSEIGGVDRALERMGRAALLRGPDDLERIELRKRGPLDPLRSNPRLLEELVELILERADRTSSTSVVLGNTSNGNGNTSNGHVAVGDPTPAPASRRLRYAAITPAHNERDNLPRLAVALSRQTHRPHTWIIVDDGSTDGTRDVIARIAAAHDWVRALHVEGSPTAQRGGPVVRAFQAGVATLEGTPDIVVKLDADVSMDPDYFDRLVGAFEEDSSLGMASGSGCDPTGDGGWVPRPVTAGHVWGPSRAYRWRCLKDVLPLEERMGWDGVDELKARALGWRTGTLTDLHFRHHRTQGRRDGARRNHWYALGDCAHFMHYRPWYLVLRALHRARQERAALMMLWGYGSAVLQRRPQCADELVRKEIRKDQSARQMPMRVREARGRRDAVASSAGR